MKWTINRISHVHSRSLPPQGWVLTKRAETETDPVWFEVQLDATMNEVTNIWPKSREEQLEMKFGALSDDQKDGK